MVRPPRVSCVYVLCECVPVVVRILLRGRRDADNLELLRDGQKMTQFESAHTFVVE